MAASRQQPIPADMPWWEVIAEGLRRSYHALIVHRDGALVVAGNRPTEASLPYVEGWLGIWTGAGFRADEALGMVLAAGNYVMGSALEFQAEAERAELRKGQVRSELRNKESYPNLRRAIECRDRGEIDPHATFEQGLALLMAGVRARSEALLADGRLPAGNDDDSTAAKSRPRRKVVP